MLTPHALFGAGNAHFHFRDCREREKGAARILTAGQGGETIAIILMPLPSRDFDPSETGVPWRVLSGLGHRFVFATPTGDPGVADRLMVTGEGLGLLAPVLKADRNGRNAYEAMITSPEFQSPLRYDAIADHSYDALLLPGGHAKGVMPYLESTLLHSTVSEFFARGKPVGAICHGVVLAARSTAASGKSVLHGRKTTALLRSQELLAWNLTRLYLGDYYRTYPTTVEDEVTAALAQPGDFQHGPLAIARDTPDRPNGFAVIDDNYVSARWPGDCHGFSRALARVIQASRRVDRRPDMILIRAAPRWCIRRRDRSANPRPNAATPISGGFFIRLRANTRQEPKSSCLGSISASDGHV